MRSCLARLPLIAVIGAIVACVPVHGQVADTNDASASVTEQAERDACKKNLGLIYKAITDYRRDNLDLPLWLSGLVPKYLQDPNTLVCPVCRRTGAVETPPLSDPKIPSSYLFEFCPVPLGDLNPKDPSRTRRDWKRRQMGVIGSVVPLVRCRHHQPTINLAFDGSIYESPTAWELAFTNMASLTSLSASNLFWNDAPRRGKYPARSPKATPYQVDLTKFYNATLTEDWLGKTNLNLSGLPRGLQTIDGVNFDLRGLIQLSGKGLNKKFPSKAGPIPVGIKCRRLHFLHAVSGWTEADAGQSGGSYFLKFIGNEARVQIPLQCGKDLGPWNGAAAAAKDLKPVWTGDLPEEENKGKVRLYRTVWNNLAPETPVESIEVASDALRGGIIVVAITAE